MSSVFDHLHIKRNTAGSSNELSFDVLDAARGDLDSKRKRKSTTPSVIKPPRPARPKTRTNIHGARGPSTLSGQVEVTRRKRERRSNSLRIWAAALFVALGFIGAATYVSYDYYQDMQEFRARFESLVSQFVEADTCLPEVERFVADPFSTTAVQRDDLKARMSKAALQLDLLEQQVGQDEEYALNDDDKSALGQVISAAEARKQMFDSVEKMTELVRASQNDESEITKVWNSVISADQQARAATSEANKAASDEAIQSALEKTEEAKQGMQEALDKLYELQAQGVEFDVSREAVYLQKRIESLEHAVNTSQALLQGDKQWAAYENDAYNEADQDAATLAQDLPFSLGEAVKDTHAERIDALRQDYNDARDAAVHADSLIRAYLR